MVRKVMLVMASVPETVQNPFNRSVHEMGNLLSEVIRSLRFYADSGYSGGDCRIENLERIQRWGGPDSLRVNDILPDTTDDLRACQACSLRAGRTQLIAGAGSAGARLMFVFGYPSFSADAENTPYAGEAGRLLTGIISAMKLTPDDVYVSHTVKCRPPGGRAPSVEETRCCMAFLEREIKAVAPDVICAFGGFSARSLLGGSEPLERLRGRFYEKEGVRIMPTWHPDDMIDDPDKKRPAWEDFQKIMRCLDIT